MWQNNWWWLIGVVIAIIIIAALVVFAMLHDMKAQLLDEEQEDSLLSTLEASLIRSRDSFLFYFTPHKRIRIISSTLCFIAIAVPLVMFSMHQWGWKESVLFYYIVGMFMTFFALFDANKDAFSLNDFHFIFLGFVITIIGSALAPLILRWIFEATGSNHRVYIYTK